MTAAEHARAYWEAGLRVFGLYGVTPDGKCGCGWPDCPAILKHPYISNWQHTPHWSDLQIETMERSKQFKTGFGVLCSGLLVIDVDERNGGVESYAELVEAIPEAASAGLIVETGSGGGSKHLYFKAPSDVALLHHLVDYPGIDFKSSGYVVGPGSLHASGNHYALVYGSPEDIDDAPAALIDLLSQPERHRAEYDGRVVDVTHDDLVDILTYIDDFDDYEAWVRCGMAIHHSSGGTAFKVWDDWSAQSEKYDAKNAEAKWHSFGRSANPVTFGTLAHYAEQGGWKLPVTFVPQTAFDLPDEDPGPPGKREDGLPFDIEGVDLKRPPGFVGELAAWIEAQSRRKRETLAVGAALVAMGNVAGLRYTDDLDGVTCNLFTFCVAGSRTGKEAIQTAQREIHKAAGIIEATHGAIKSEQEITRNLVANQAALYIIDEIGMFLRKIKNAQDKGGAVYLDGVIGLLMSAYSKADGFLLLTGDARRDLVASLTREAAVQQKAIDENDDKSFAEARLTQLKHALDSVEQGLERPFVSVAGYTTPETFESLMDFASATNGFIGRALIFNDRETAPPTKPNFLHSYTGDGRGKPPMSGKMAATLAQIFDDGNYDITAGSRVEFYGNRREIPTDHAAGVMLEDVLSWFEEQAVFHKSRSGLEALYLGAYELVSKVSLILAVPLGVRTSEDVRWAFALVRRDVDDKARLVIANDREKDSPKMALEARIINIIAGDGETQGIIRNRLRKHRAVDVDKALDGLVKRGLAFRHDVKPPRGPTAVIFSTENKQW